MDHLLEWEEFNPINETTIKELESQLKDIRNQMENDPSVELEGGKNSDKYGSKLEKIEKSISDLNNKKKDLNSKKEDILTKIDEINNKISDVKKIISDHKGINSNSAVNTITKASKELESLKDRQKPLNKELESIKIQIKKITG